MLYFDPFGLYVIICTCTCMFHNFYLSVLWLLLVNTASNNSPNSTMKHYEKLWNLVKVNNEGTPKERQCFLMSQCQWSHPGGYSSMWISFNIYLSIIYFIWCTARYTMRQTCVPLNNKRSTKLWGPQRSPEIALRSKNFCVPENLIFPALNLTMSIDWK